MINKNRGDDTIFIFDLDGTTVDSRHRTSLPFSLDYWNENSTRENILKDRLMPLSRKMVELINPVLNNLNPFCFLF